MDIQHPAEPPHVMSDEVANGRPAAGDARVQVVESYGLHSSIHSAVFDFCRSTGVLGPEDVVSDVVLWQGDLLPFLSDIVVLGGSWKAVSETVVWDISDFASQEMVDRVSRVFPMAQFEHGRRTEAMVHAEGIFEVKLEGLRAVIWSGHRTSRHWHRPEVLVIMAQEREKALALLHRVLATRKRHRLSLWGGAADGATPPPITVEEVVIPEPLKSTLLQEIDRFWTVATLATKEGITARRGLLFVGPPGTGKTQLVRHLLTRYPEVDAHLFISGTKYHSEDAFGEMLANLRKRRRPAMVILEDIDRLESSGAVTAEYLLNCLDGLLESSVPTLWIATSNDPAQLDQNLLNRPGRFDRTIVFDLPDPDLRKQLILLHTREKPGPNTLAEAEAASEGLSGAHIKEACIAARLATLDSGRPLDGALMEQIRRLQRQNRKARELGRSLSATRAGFAAG